MGINVRVQDAPKQSGIIAAQVNLEKDLRRDRTGQICALDVRTNSQNSIVFPA